MSRSSKGPRLDEAKPFQSVTADQQVMDDDVKPWVQLYGLLGRTRIFCEFLETCLRQQVLPVAAEMRDLAPKLEMFRSLAVGLFDFSQSHLGDSSFAPTRGARNVGLVRINGYYLNLFLGFCGSAVASFKDRRSESSRGEWSETEANDHLALLTCHLSHCLTTLAVWQEVVRATATNNDDWLWQDVPLQFPIACDPTLTARNGIDGIRRAIEGKDAVQLAMASRQLFFASLYLAVFRPRTWMSDWSASIGAAIEAIRQRVERISSGSATDEDAEAKALARICVESITRQAEYYRSWHSPSDTHVSDSYRERVDPPSRAITEASVRKPVRWHLDQTLFDAWATWPAFPFRRVSFSDDIPPFRVGVSEEFVADIGRVIGRQFGLSSIRATREPWRGDRTPRYDVLLEKSSGTRKSAHRNFALEMTIPDLTATPRSRTEVDRSEFDVPWLVARALSGPFDQEAAPTVKEPKVLADRDQLQGDERVASLVTLACHLLERLWISNGRLANVPTRVDMRPAESKLHVLKLKEIIAGRCLGGRELTTSAQAVAIRKTYDRYCEYIDTLTGNRRSESGDEFDLTKIEHLPWLLLSIVVFRLTDGGQEDRLTKVKDPATDRLSLPLGQAIPGPQNFAIWHDLPSLVGLTRETLIDGLKRLLARVSIDAPGTPHLSLEIRDGYWTLVNAKRSTAN